MIEAVVVGVLMLVRLWVEDLLVQLRSIAARCHDGRLVPEL